MLQITITITITIANRVLIVTGGRHLACWDEKAQEPAVFLHYSRAETLTEQQVLMSVTSSTLSYLGLDVQYTSSIVNIKECHFTCS